MSKEQPPVREVIPYKAGKRPSTFRKLKVEFAGTALEQAIAERDSQQIANDTEKSVSAKQPKLTTDHSPPVTTSHHHSPKNSSDRKFPTATNKQEALQLVEDNRPHPNQDVEIEGESPPLPTTPQSEISNEPQIAPGRDFNRRANSIERDAMPAGLFPGSTKKVYDALYLRTRGAVVPSKMVQASRRDLLTWTGIRNLKTIDNHIRYLLAKGLIIRHWELGSNEGSSYEVRLPEEVIGNQYPPLPTSGGESPLSTTPQFLGIPTTQKLGSGGESQILDNKATYGFDKTIKTNDDDETHTQAEFAKPLFEAARSVVGGELTNSEQERKRWRELGRLLADELRKAAQNTDAISSIPAFFTAHLRRRLLTRMMPPPAREIKREISFEPKQGDEQSSTPKAGQSVTQAPDDISERKTATRGSSRFSLEECRRYADHLHQTGQGITNPGGFAMTIHRSGISDALVEKFLRPAVETPPDTSACPDCSGIGFYYPQGAGQGVVKCEHEGLTRKEMERRLSREEIEEQAGIIGELLESGYTLEQAEIQFAASLERDDWASIRAEIERKKLT